MVGEDVKDLDFVQKLVELALKHNLQQITVGNIVIVPRPEAPKPIDVDALAKKLQDEAKITDEDILMNPYAGMNNLPQGGAVNG